MSRLLRNPHARPPRGGSAVLTDGSPAGLVLRGLLFPASAVPAQATLYFVIYPAAQPAPTAAQIVAGQNSAGSAAVASGSESARSTTGEQIFANAAGGLAPSTSYLIAFVAYNGTSFSNVAVAEAFTTSPAGSAFFRTNVGGITIVGSIRRTSRVRRLGVLTLVGIVRKLTRVRRLGSLTLSAVLAAIKQGGSQTYQRAVGGTIAMAGAVRRFVRVRRLGSLTASGIVRKRSTRRLASAITGITGNLRKFSRARVLTGSLTPSGTVSNRYVVLRFVSGSITVAGQVRKFTRRRLLGAVTAAGALRKRTARRLVGAIAMAGEVRKRTRRRVTATIVASGATIRRFAFKVAAASVITVTGTLARLFSPASPFEPFSQRLTHLRRFIGRR